MVIGTILVLMLGTAAPHAAEDALVVAPDVLEIPARQRGVELSLVLEGSVPRAVRLGVLSWSQDESGRVVLAPADELAISPARTVLEPRETRHFRLSRRGPAPEVERAYRIWIAVCDVESAPTITALVPAFVLPATRSIAPEVHVSCEQARCRLVISNHGSVRIWPQMVSFAVVGEGIEQEQHLDPWWVLAEGRRAYDVEIPAPPSSREIVARVTIDGRKFEARAEIRR